MIKRRQFIAGFGSAAAWPVVARAQQTAMPVIGWLDLQSPEAARESVPAFQQGLAETGYVEGRNVTVEYRWAENHIDTLPALAADLVRRRVAVIAAVSTASALAAKAATQTIPIVFRVGSDPVEIGLVATFNRPAGNLTGIASLTAGIISKRLALLHELVPAVTIATLVNPANPRFAQIETRDAAAGVLGVRILALNAGTASDIAGAFATLVQRQAGALLISADGWFMAARDQITSLAARYAIPTMFSDTVAVAAGGLLSYGQNFPPRTIRLGFMLVASSMVRGRPTFRSCSRPSSSSSSTSRLPRRSALPSQKRCWRPQMR
jgi:putative ABC transport system substrate-binding protein